VWLSKTFVLFSCMQLGALGPPWTKGELI